MDVLNQYQQSLSEGYPDILLVCVGINSCEVLEAFLHDKVRYAGISKHVKTIFLHQGYEVRFFEDKADYSVCFTERSYNLTHIHKVFERYISNINMVIIVTEFNTPFGAIMSPLLAKYFAHKTDLIIGMAYTYDTPHIPYAGVVIKDFKEHINSFVQITGPSISNFAKPLTGKISKYGLGARAMAEALYCHMELVLCDMVYSYDLSELQELLRCSGTGFLGYGIARGDNRAEFAVTQALQNLPISAELFQHVDRVLFLIRCNFDMMVEEVSTVRGMIADAMSDSANILYQVPLNREDDALSVTIIAYDGILMSEI